MGGAPGNRHTQFNQQEEPADRYTIIMKLNIHTVEFPKRYIHI